MSTTTADASIYYTLDGSTPPQAAINPSDLVYHISASSGAQEIRNFDGLVTINIPYEGPLPAIVWYLDNAGNLEKMPHIYNAATKVVAFNTNHLSLFVVGQENNDIVKIRPTIGMLSYSVRGVTKTMDAAPEIVNNRTMVPLRFIAEALGAKVDWNAESRTAIVDLGNRTLRVTIGETAPGMDVPDMILNNRVMVPRRYVSETLGCDVFWAADTRTIDITKPHSDTLNSSSSS